ncbi:MAG: hypothetical protein ACRENM_04975 [Candidatus Dormibacteraceae bacterium]
MLADGSHVVLTGSNQATGVVHLGEEFGLARFQIFGRDGFVEVGVDELLLLTFQFD